MGKLKICFDISGNPEIPTFILSKRNGDKLGIIQNIENDSINISDDTNNPAEFSFIVHQKLNNTMCSLWNDIADFRLIYVSEWNKWFEISVSIDEDNKITKTVSASSLPEAELSQLSLNDVEINTEDDIARDDYVEAPLFDEENPDRSILGRILHDKAQHYIINHVDPSIAKLQRAFSFNNISIYDAFLEIAKEINCIFVYGEENPLSPMSRTISVYDLESNCKDCGYRGEYLVTCPECGSTDILDGFGEDTTVFLSSENLAENINYSTDVTSIKNCFRLEAGDDLMTATVVNANPSGSQYLWYISDSIKKDMSESLTQKLDSYNERYLYYQKDFQTTLSPSYVTRYNQLIDKYKGINTELTPIDTPIIGYENLMKSYYDVIDLYGYLQNSMMPTGKPTETTAKDQAALLTSANLSPVSLKDASYISLATANSTILAYAKILIDTAKYKVKVKNSSLNSNIWTGNFTLTSYYDEEDTADSATISVTINDDYENFIRQQIEKALDKSEKDNLSIVGLFKLSDDEFKAELQRYGLSYLQIFNDACQSCIDIMIEQGVSDRDTWKDPNNDLYTKMYIPYLNKKTLIDNELKVRESELYIVGGKMDENGDIETKGIKQYIEDVRSLVGKELDFEKYIGDDWIELCSFRRDDTWKNDNYISDGLNNKELFEKSKEFLDAANKDIYKSANLQHTITSTLKNLFVMKEFEPLYESFKIGNWIRIQIDDQIYKLRLVNYSIDYGNLNELSSVEFSDVVKNNTDVDAVKESLKRSQSISGTYNSVKRQAKLGKQSKDTVDEWEKDGISTSNMQIADDPVHPNILYGKHGLLCRKYDPISETYSPTQIKIINSNMSLTTDNWKTSKVGIGEFEFYNPKTHKLETGYGIVANQLIGDLILSKEVGIYNESGSLTFDDDNGLNVANDINSFNVNPNNKSLMSLKKKNTDIFTVDEDGNLYIAGKFKAYDLELAPDVEIDISNVTGMEDVIKKDQVIGKNPNIGVIGFKVSSTGILESSSPILYDAELYTHKGSIAGFNVSKNALTFKDSVEGIYSGISSSSCTLFAGGKLLDGSDGKTKLLHDGSFHTSKLYVENSGFNITNKAKENVLWIDDEDHIAVNDISILKNLKLFDGLCNIGTSKTIDEVVIQPKKKLSICSIDSTATKEVDVALNVIGKITGKQVWSNDAWNVSSKCVVSSNGDDITLKYNVDQLEFWVNKKLIGVIKMEVA